MDCLFCNIVDKRIPSDTVYEDEKVLAFRDIAPHAPTHILIIPKHHITTLNDIESSQAELIGHMVFTAKTIAREQGLADDGYRLVFNCNEDAGQTVFHIHLHLLGGRAMTWPPG